MEYAEGGDLSGYIKKAKNSAKTAANDSCCLPEKQIWRFTEMICKGLSHLHSMNVIHKDIKP